MQTSFDKFDQTVKTYLSKTFNSLGLQYSHSQVFGVIFDGLKGIMQNAMFYIEDALTEQNIFKASRKTSVYSLAKISGFEAYYGSTSTGSIILRQKVNNFAVESAQIIPKIHIRRGTRLINKNSGVVYSIDIPTEYYIIDLRKPLVSHQLKIVQGVFIKGSYVASGKNLETIHVSSSELFDKDYITVTVDGEKWDPVSSLYDMIPGEKQYLISIGYDNAFDITFGNSSLGKKLNPGQTVMVEYLTHGGSGGNILSNEVPDMVFKDKLYTNSGETIDGGDYLLLSLKNSVSGGTNSDSISFIRNMIGANSRSLVLASEDNFKLFFRRFSFVGYVNCWSELNSMIITTTCLKKISSLIKNDLDYYKISKKDLLLSVEEKEMMENTLANSKKTFAGVTIKFKDPIIRRFAFICYVKEDNIFNRDIITDGIKTTLAKYFMKLFEGVQFIPKSDIIKACLDENPNIKSIEIDIISELAEETFYNGYYEQYYLEYINGTYDYVSKKIIYEPQTVPGLDIYGNISLSSKLEVPVLQGGFQYYYNKSENDKNSNILIDTVQVLFI